LTRATRICYTRLLRQAHVESEARCKWQMNAEPEDGGARAHGDGGRSSASIARIPEREAPSTTRTLTCFGSSSMTVGGSARLVRPATAASTRVRLRSRSSAPARWHWSSTPATSSLHSQRSSAAQSSHMPARLSLCLRQALPAVPAPFSPSSVARSSRSRSSIRHRRAAPCRRVGPHIPTAIARPPHVRERDAHDEHCTTLRVTRTAPQHATALALAGDGPPGPQPGLGWALAPLPPGPDQQLDPDQQQKHRDE